MLGVITSPMGVARSSCGSATRASTSWRVKTPRGRIPSSVTMMLPTCSARIRSRATCTGSSWRQVIGARLMTDFRGVLRELPSVARVAEPACTLFRALSSRLANRRVQKSWNTGLRASNSSNPSRSSSKQKVSTSAFCTSRTGRRESSAPMGKHSPVTSSQVPSSSLTAWLGALPRTRPCLMM
jgi:hypothetical protein